MLEVLFENSYSQACVPDSLDLILPSEVVVPQEAGHNRGSKQQTCHLRGAYGF